MTAEEIERRERTGPPFFIVGSARSGTTLLRLMLNAHAEVAVPPESRFIVELYPTTENVDADEFLESLSRHRQFVTWDLPIEAVREEVGNRPAVAYGDAIRAAYRAYARVRGKPRWGDKTPRYVLHIPLLARLFPDARFVHLIRDGRNVALSYANVRFGPKTVTKAAKLWSTRVSAGYSTGRALGRGRYLEIRYEDLVADAGGQIKLLCEFLELDFDPGMLDHTERARDAVLPRAPTYNPRVTAPPMSGGRSWEDEMPAAQIEVFEAIAGPILTELGYPRRFPKPGRAARVRAAAGRIGIPLGRIESSRHG